MSAVPVGLKKKGNKEFLISWKDGHESTFSAAELRRACRCALCENELTGERKLKDSDVPENLELNKASLTGSYAISFEFSDGHGSGIYSFETLRAACPCCRQRAT